MTIGFVLNLWVVFCVMLFKTSWRIAYFRFVDELYDKIYVTVAVRFAIWKRKYGIRSWLSLCIVYATMGLLITTELMDGTVEWHLCVSHYCPCNVAYEYLRVHFDIFLT